MCSNITDDASMEAQKKAYYEYIDGMLGENDCDSLEKAFEWPCSSSAIVSASPIIFAILMVFFLMK